MVYKLKLVDSINPLQANLLDVILSELWIPKLLDVILSELWIPKLKTITRSYTEVKLSAVASSNLLCKYPSLFNSAAEDLWGKLLNGIVTLPSKPEDEGRVEDELDFGGRQHTFVRFYNAACMKNPLEEIKDPKHFMVSLLANLSSQFQGRFLPVITKYLSPANQASLLQLCNSYNLAFIYKKNPVVSR